MCVCVCVFSSHDPSQATAVHSPVRHTLPAACGVLTHTLRTRPLHAVITPPDTQSPASVLTEQQTCSRSGFSSIFFFFASSVLITCPFTSKRRAQHAGTVLLCFAVNSRHVSHAILLRQAFKLHVSVLNPQSFAVMLRICQI